MGVGNGRELETRAWEGILPAFSDPSPENIEQFSRSRPPLVQITKDPYLRQTQSGAYLHARLTLGSWAVMEGVAKGDDPIKPEAFLNQRKAMTKLMRDATGRRYLIESLRPYAAAIVTDAALFTMFARYPQSEAFAYPSPPYKRDLTYYDPDSGLTSHHLYLATSLGYAPTFLTPSSKVEDYTPTTVCKMRLGPMLLAAAKRFPDIQEVSRRAGKLTSGLYALIDYAMHSMAQEDPDVPLPSDPVSEVDAWLRITALLAAEAAKEFCAQRPQ